MTARSALAALVLAVVAPAALAQSTAFTYQGELKSNGVPANGLHDLRFKLWNAASGGLLMAPIACVDNVQVTSGKFTATIDFGTAFVTSGARFIEVDVRQDTGLDCTNTTGFGTLNPRTQVNAAPFATYANKASALTPANGTGVNAVSVDTSGNVGIGTATPANRLSVAGTANFTGNVGIGTTTPGVPLHIVSTSLVPAIAVASPFAVLQLQDTGANANQTGYVSYRNATGTETAWTGFGSPGDPDFSIVNARPAGDIVLNALSGNIALYGGNVGIGTTSPAAKLEVRGDVRVGPFGQFFASSGEENLRLVRGTVLSSGTVSAGSGWTVSRSATGQYVVLYTTPFASPPTVTATTAGTGGNVANITSNNTLGFTYSTYNSGGSLTDLGVYFTAVGPR